MNNIFSKKSKELNQKIKEKKLYKFDSSDLAPFLQVKIPENVKVIRKKPEVQQQIKEDLIDKSLFIENALDPKHLR